MAPKVARFPWSDAEHEQLSNECSVTPAPPDWRQALLSDKNPLQLGRPLRVLIPCCGNDCGECFKHMGIDWELVGAFDLQEEYKSLIEHYVKLYGGGTDLTGKLHVGKIEGDICNYNSCLRQMSLCPAHRVHPSRAWANMMANKTNASALFKQ